jgi:hypothetical protein|tara:strand:+ start:5851 stop:6024 length:174 start_codon:yes stop_codon:yes gene_type:complete
MNSKTMPHRQASKTCQNCKSEFTIEPEDFEFYKKIDVLSLPFVRSVGLKEDILFGIY